MTAQERPPSRPSRKLRNRIAGVAVGLLLAGVLGACAGHVAPTATPIDTSPVASEPAVTAAPSTALLEISGKGGKTSDDFAASGDSVDVNYSYNCAEPGSFTLNFYGSNVSPELPDVITDEFGTQRSDTTTEQLNGAAGPFHVEVVTECEWSVKVLGAR